MKLQDTITLHAGGPGSGCKGPNCGKKTHDYEWSGDYSHPKGSKYGHVSKFKCKNCGKVKWSRVK